ncbi:MAG: hypothetical protein GX868_13485 [Actinobacteria bacterium]|nr:hypothetical protein [Actinomycetota bacterium]
MHRANQIAERQHGLVHRNDLVRAQLQEHEIRRVTRSEHWEHLGRSTYRRTGAPRTHLQTVMAAVLQTGPGAALFGPTAFWLWLYDNTAPRQPIHVMQRSGCATSSLRDVRLHRVKDLSEPWVVMHRDIPVARPPLVAVQLFSMRRYEAAERQVDRLWSHRLLSGRSIEGCLAELGASGRNGIGGLRAYLAERGPDWVPPASGLEGRVMQIMREVGIATRRQVGSGEEDWTGRVDMKCTGWNVLIEAQSELYHTSLSDARADALRLAKLAEDGFVVVEITDTEAYHSPRVAVQRVQAALRSPQARRMRSD